VNKRDLMGMKEKRITENFEFKSVATTNSSDAHETDDSIVRGMISTIDSESIT
jgi:hypothetical protein